MRGKLEAGYKLETGQLDNLADKLENWTTGQLEITGRPAGTNATRAGNSQPGGRAGIFWPAGITHELEIFLKKNIPF